MGREEVQDQAPGSSASEKQVEGTVPLKRKQHTELKEENREGKTATVGALEERAFGKQP